MCVSLVVRYFYCFCIVGCVVARVVFVLPVCSLLPVVVCWLLFLAVNVLFSKVLLVVAG